MEFVFHRDDADRYKLTRPGEVFRPRYVPAGIWLQLDDFTGSPIYQELLERDLVEAVIEAGDVSSGIARCASGACEMNSAGNSKTCGQQCCLESGHLGEHRCCECLREEQREERAKGLYCISPMESTFTWRSSDTHSVKREAVPLSHANYMTSTGCQGYTIVYKPEDITTFDFINQLKGSQNYP